MENHYTTLRDKIQNGGKTIPDFVNNFLENFEKKVGFKFFL